MKYVHTVGSRGSPELDLKKQRRLMELVEANYDFEFGGDLDGSEKGDLHLSFFGNSGFQVQPYGNSFIKMIQFSNSDVIERARVVHASPEEVFFYLYGREIHVKYGDESMVSDFFGERRGRFDVKLDKPRPKLDDLPELVSAGPCFLSFLSGNVSHEVYFRTL
jgi:hypothetical protein